MLPQQNFTGIHEKLIKIVKPTILYNYCCLLALYLETRLSLSFHELSELDFVHTQYYYYTVWNFKLSPKISDKPMSMLSNPRDNNDD